MNSKDYKIESVGVDEAYFQRDQYPYALVYCYSYMKLCETSELTEKDWDECREARFFGPIEELHVLIEEGRAIHVTEIGTKAVLDKEYKISRRFRNKKWNRVTIRQYLEADEDGQMRIVLTRLMDLK